MKKNLQIGKKIALALVLFLTVAVVNAADRYLVATGNWNATSSWSATSGGGSGASVPVAGDNVFIEGDRTLTVTTNAACASITFASGAAFTSILNINSGITLTVSGTITIPRTGTADFNRLAVGAGILSVGNIAFTNGGGTNRHEMTISTGTVTVSGNITATGATGSATITFSGAGLLQIAGTMFTNAQGAFTQSTSTVEYNGAGAQTVADFTYYNLTLANSGAKTVTGTTIENKLSIQGTATAAGTSPTYSTAILEYKGSAAQNTSNVEFPAALTASVIIDNAAGVTLNAGKTINGNLTLTDGTLVAGTNLSMSTTGTPLITRSGGSMTGTLQGAADYDVTFTENSKTTGAELSGTGLADIIINLAVGETLTLDQNRAPDGNLSVSAGTFDLVANTINRSSAGGTLTVGDGATLKIGGTNSFPSNYSPSIGNTSATVEYAGSAQAVAALAGESYTNLTLSGSGVKTLAAETVNGRLSIQGTATLAGTSPTYGTNAILEYKGSAAQNTSNVEFPATVNVDLVIDNGSGVTLNGAKNLSGSLTLTNGVVNTTATNILNMGDNYNVVIGGSVNSYINGPMRKTGNNSFTFPVGKAGIYSPITISAPNENTDAFTAEYVRSSATALGSITATGIFRVSNCEYWDLDETADPGNNNSINVTVGWFSYSGCSSWPYISTVADIRLVHFNGTNWDTQAGTATGTVATGTVTRNAVTAFSPFTLGSVVDEGNALPVSFANVKAFEKGTGVQIEWTNLTESDISGYVVERSANGIDFTAIGQVAPRSNQADKASYIYNDLTPLNGTNFYRVKALELAGKSIYTKSLRVDMGRTVKGISLYPNPVKGSDITIAFSAGKGLYNMSVLNTAGQVVYRQQLNHAGGTVSQQVSLPSLKAGMYNVLVSGDNYKETKMFVIQ